MLTLVVVGLVLTFVGHGIKTRTRWYLAFISNNPSQMSMRPRGNGPASLDDILHDLLGYAFVVTGGVLLIASFF